MCFLGEGGGTGEAGRANASPGLCRFGVLDETERGIGEHRSDVVAGQLFQLRWGFSPRDDANVAGAVRRSRRGHGSSPWNGSVPSGRGSVRLRQWPVAAQAECRLLASGGCESSSSTRRVGGSWSGFADFSRCPDRRAGAVDAGAAAVTVAVLRPARGRGGPRRRPLRRASVRRVGRRRRRGPRPPRGLRGYGEPAPQHCDRG